MKTVSTIEELKENLDTMDRYIANKHDPEYSFAIDLIKKGICFVPRVVDGHVHFYPSRFIGYVHNTMTLHENNENKDGRETNPVIWIDCIGVVNNLRKGCFHKKGKRKKSTSCLHSLLNRYIIDRL